MKRRILFLLLIAIVVSLSMENILHFSRNVTNNKYIVIESIIRDGLVDNDYAHLMSSAIKTAKSKYEDISAIVINRIPKDGELSFILLDMSAKYSDDQYEIVKSCVGNLVVVGEKYIIADKNFISMLVISTFNEFANVDQAYSILRLSKNDNPTPEIRSAFIINEIKYLSNVAHFIENDSDSINESLNPIKIALNVDESLLSSFGEAFAVVISPFLLHELGHIYLKHTGALLDNIDTTLTDATVSAVREQEEMADKFAISAVGKALNTMSKHYSVTDVENVKRGVYIVGKILESLSFHNRFFRFRDMNAQSIGNIIIYNDERDAHDCEQPHWGFVDFGYISDIRESLFPIISLEEYMNFVGQEDIARTHRQPFERSKMFQKYALNDFRDMFGIVSTYASDVRRVLSGDLYDLTRDELLKAYTSDILRVYPGRMRQGIEFPPALLEALAQDSAPDTQPVVCPFEDCILWKDKDVGVYIELGFINKLLVYGSLYIRSLSTRPKGWNTAWEDATIQSIQRFQAKASLLYFIFNIFSGNNSQGQIKDFVERVIMCYFSSLTHESEHGTTTISTYDNDKSVYMVFVSN